MVTAGTTVTAPIRQPNRYRQPAVPGRSGNQANRRKPLLRPRSRKAGLQVECDASAEKNKRSGVDDRERPVDLRKQRDNSRKNQAAGLSVELYQFNLQVTRAYIWISAIDAQGI